MFIVLYSHFLHQIQFNVLPFEYMVNGINAVLGGDEKL